MSGVKRGLAVLALIVLALFVWWSRPGPLDPMDRAVEAVLDMAPTGAVVVFDGGSQPQDARAYGSLSDRKSPEALRFRLASLTKPVAAAAVLHLVEQGDLALSDTLPGLLPQLALGDPRAAQITVRDLLRHSSGIDETELPPLFVAPDQLSSELGLQADQQSDCREIAAAMLVRPLAFAPGTEYLYSNTGYCLLGWILEATTGLPLEKALHALIREASPLTFEKVLPDVEGKIPDGQNDWLVLQPSVVGAAGGLIGSADDYLAFMARGVPVEVADEPPYAFENGHFYGLGWRIWPAHDCPARTHFGSMPGAFSVAVVGDDDQRMVALFEGRPPEDWPAFAAVVTAVCAVFDARR